ncbi:MAG: O-methyltransferase [Bdellovibrio sp.]|nr:MAG: O-methyltransferase [Bdellovibrio sp.]
MRSGNSKIDLYINEVFAPEDSHLRSIRMALKQSGLEGIHISPYEGKLLQFLMKISQAKKVIELGTLYGYSTLWMARALPANGKIVSIEKNSKNHHAASEFLSHTESFSKIQLVKGDAKQILSEHHEFYDFIFIDADKASYPFYLDWAETHIKKGGLIVADNTLLFGHLVGQPREIQVTEDQIVAMKAFNTRLASPQKFCSILIPTYEGLTVAQVI